MEAATLAERLHIEKKEAESLLLRYRRRFAMVTKYLGESGNCAKIRLEARTMFGFRRKFEKPTWERAKEKAIERAVEYGRTAETVDSKDLSRAYYSMFSGIEREGKNTPIQGTNAQMAKLACGCGFDKNGKPFMWHTLWPKFKAMWINFVHDEFVVESKKEVGREVCDVVGDCMMRAGAAVIKKVEMTYDAHIEEHWTK